MEKTMTLNLRVNPTVKPVSYTHLKGEKAAELQRKKKKALTGCRAATARVER